MKGSRPGLWAAPSTVRPSMSFTEDIWAQKLWSLVSVKRERTMAVMASGAFALAL